METIYLSLSARVAVGPFFYEIIPSSSNGIGTSLIFKVTIGSEFDLPWIKNNYLSFNLHLIVCSEIKLVLASGCNQSKAIAEISAIW